MNTAILIMISRVCTRSYARQPTAVSYEYEYMCAVVSASYGVRIFRSSYSPSASRYGMMRIQVFIEELLL